MKFSSQWTGSVQSFLQRLPQDMKSKYHMELKDMADALWELEDTGAAPILPDGKVGGNAAFRLIMADNEEVIVLSKSGKTSGQNFNIDEDVCVVTNFNTDTWCAEYLSTSIDVLPTSDSPMHHAALSAHKQFHWSEMPNAILHGHALETEEEAAALGLPISTEETLFSTPEDTQALMTLFEGHPYPQNKIFIRKGHGFLLLGQSMQDALETFRKSILPNVVKH